MNKTFLYAFYHVIMGMCSMEEKQEKETAEEEKYFCKDCKFYKGGAFCKEARHHISQLTIANKCSFFTRNL